MAVGRISGPLLKSNLIRNGIDLAFETDLLYLDVNNQRIGIKTITPQHELDVNGTTRTTNLIVTNRADIGDIDIQGNTISTPQQYLNLGTLDNVVYQNKLRVDSIDIEGNAISTNDSNANLELRPNGTGSVDVYSDMNVTGDIYATGNITADGNITIGDADTDNVVFNAEVASDIIPDQSDTYKLGSDPSTGGKEWNDLWVNNIIASSVSSGDLEVDGIDLTLRQGNIYYVAENGDDSKSGTHPQDPYASLTQALSAAVAGDTVYIYPGVYEETFPLTVPAGVTVKGHSLRGVKIVPTTATNTNNAFLLNGETTVADLTIADFYQPGYAFRFAPNFTVTTRSPYIKNVTVITQGSVTTAEDPRGFNQGDAGGGVYFDGAVATASSNEASGLFHSVTFITPGVDAVQLTNGVRVEWLNCFTYFANRSVYAFDGASGLKGTGETAIRVDEVTGSFSAGETIEYYDTDGVTLLESATISSIDATGKIFVSGKQTGFETAEQRGGKTISANGDAQLSTSIKKFGSASLALDGTGDYASITSQTDFGFGTGDFTVEFWYYQTAGSGIRALADFRSAATQESVYIGTSSAVPFLYINGSFVINSSATLSNGQWYHIAVTRSGTTARLFVNGTDTGSATVSNDLGSSRSLNIGANYLGTGAYVSGYFDDLRIIKGSAITPPSGGPTTTALVTPETVLMARFDGDNASTTFEDDVVYAQDVRFSGGATANKISLTDFTDFGAEVRMIGSASVYGNFGLVGDGAGVLMYAIGHNLAYIGVGKEVTNDPQEVIQINEVVETNDAQIRYNSVDHKGDFRVGDLFYVNQEDGTVNFSVSDFTINTTGGVTFTNNGDTTFIDGDRVETGDWRISSNTIETLTQDANFNSAGGDINLNANVNVTGNLDVTGNVTIGGNITIGDEATDTIQFVAGIDSDIVPKVDSAYSLGTSAKTWSNLWVNQINADDIEIRDNYIQTTASNADLELRANGTGVIYVPSNDVQIDNNLTVSGTATLAGTNITGTVTLVGDFDQTGNHTVTGDVAVGENLNVGAAAQFEEILIDDNFITTTTSNTDLELRASGTGRVLIPNNDVDITNDLSVTGDVDANNVAVTANVTSNSANIGDVQITNSLIESTASSADLELRANGTGVVDIPVNDVTLGQALTVSGATDLQGTTVTGTIIHVGDTTQTGDFDITGSFTNGDILVDSNTITTTLSNSDLELRANGTGEILVPTNDVVLGQALTVSGDTDLQATNITGTITHVGNTVQTGTFSISGDFDNGNISINDNVITTTESDSNLELRASGTGEVVVPTNDVVLGQALTVSGATDLQSTTVNGTITHTGDVTQTGNYTITGSWTNGDLQFDSNVITTTQSNSDLDLRANGTGEIVVPNNNVAITNNLTVSGDTDLQDTAINGTLTHTGDTVQVGNYAVTGNVSISGTLDVDSAAQFENVRIDGNVVSTTDSNSDLELRASGTGDVVVPDNDVQITNDLFVDGTITVGDVTSAGTITANRFSTGDILIDDNFITTTLSNSDLELRANGTGDIVVPSNDVVFEQNLTVNGVTDLDDTNIVGDVTHTGNTVQTGNINLTGNLNIDGEVTVSSAAQFENIRIEGNTVQTTDSNSNLELAASGSGSVIVPNNDVAVTGNLAVDGTFSVGAISSSGTIQANNFTTGDILIDDNFITTTTSNSDLELRASGTGSIVIDNFDINNSTISSSTDITLEPGSENVVIDATGSVRLPVGTTLERPAAQTGQIRFNSDLNRYEGYNGSNWIQLNGVVDLDGDTRVTAELTEGANDNTIRFDIAGSTLVTIDENQLEAPRVVVDDVAIDGNTITTTVSDTDLVLGAQGTGSVVFDNFAFKDNTITNTVSDSVTEFVNTNNGYVKFDGTYGLVLPSGTTSQRPQEEFTETGMTRFNTTDGRVEVWDGTQWISVAGAESGISRSDAENIAFEIVLSLG